MRKIFFYLICLIMFCSLSFVSASESTTIDVEILVGDVITEKDNLLFEYTITNRGNHRWIEFSPSIECKGDTGVDPSLTQKIRLYLKDSYSSKFHAGDASIYSPSVCLAEIVFTEPFTNTYYKQFSLSTFPELKLKILTCSDSKCKYVRNRFYENEDIYYKLVLESSEWIGDWVETRDVTKNENQFLTIGKVEGYNKKKISRSEIYSSANTLDVSDLSLIKNLPSKHLSESGEYFLSFYMDTGYKPIVGQTNFKIIEKANKRDLGPEKRNFVYKFLNWLDEVFRK